MSNTEEFERKAEKNVKRKKKAVVLSSEDEENSEEEDPKKKAWVQETEEPRDLGLSEAQWKELQVRAKKNGVYIPLAHCISKFKGKIVRH